MTDFSQYTDQQLAEAITFYRRQRNGAVGLNESAHMRAKNFVRLAEAEQARRLEEAIDYSKEKPNQYVIYKRKNGQYGVSQETRNGSWDHSYHHGYHDTVDSAKAWAAKHAGKYPHKIEVQEEVEQIDELKRSTLSSYLNKSMKSKDKSDGRSFKDTVLGKPPRDEKTFTKRRRGINTAINKLSGSYVARVIPKEEAEQIDEISTELKKRYVEKGADDVVDRFTGRGKYERPRNPAHFTKTGRVKKSALNRPEAIKYREKLDNRREIVNKVSQEVHGKKRFGEEVEFKEESNLRITKIYNKWPKKATYAVHTPDRKYFKEFDSMEAAKAHHDEKTNNK